MTTSTSTRILWATLACALTLVTGQVALADDTDIFFGQNAGGGVSSNPNVLLILDSSGSMSNDVDDDPFGRDRLEVVQDVATDFINNMTDVNIGLMKYDVRGGDDDADVDGGMVVHAMSDVASSRSSLISEVNNIYHVGNTPLQETYLEAALYMVGGSVYYGKYSYEGYKSGDNYYRRSRPSVDASRSSWNSNYYKSPIIGACQRNYIVYLTDGLPTYDKNGTPVIETVLNNNTFTDHTARSCDNPDGLTEGGECIDELAEFLYENDFNRTLPGQQNVISHFIGFAEDLTFLERAAASGGGSYFPANDAATLRTALQEIFTEVADDVNGFTAPAVTVNAFDRTTHLDQLFFTVFQPNERNHWDGNLKKYRFVPRANEDGLLIVGQDGIAAVNPDSGFFYDGKDALGNPDASVPTAWSYWSTAADGADVRLGGAAERFGASRNILTNSGNTLVTLNRSNSAARSALIGLPVPTDTGTVTNADDATVDRWLDWAAGIDVNDDDTDGLINDPRTRMGDPLHSKPSVVVYGGTAAEPELTLFVGTNDGYLHAIDGKTGDERFAFMPESLLGNLPELVENPKLGASDRVYGVDGPITVWKDDGGDGKIDSGDHVYLYFGLRRGGTHYYALDVTDPANPTLMWQFSQLDDANMGQSWSTPVRTTVNFGSEDTPSPKDVLIFGGGYDTDQDTNNSYADDDVGNAIFMLDAITGAKVWSASESGATLNLSEMKSAIPGGIRAIDMNLDGMAERMYAVDIAGRLWRFDMHNESSLEISGGVIANLGGNGAANNRRFYYAPDASLGSDDYGSFVTITAASGFRADPLESQIDDYLIGVRDYQPFAVLGADSSDDYDYGIGLSDLQTISATSTSGLPAGSAGWKYALADSEKSLARSRVFQGLAYFTSYKPGAAPSSNPCAPAVGSGALYTIDLASGAVQRKQLNKPGIPPEPTFIFGRDDQDDLQLDDCFGPHCDDYTPPEEDPDCDSSTETCTEEYEETEGTGRQVECLAGPESCDADGNEFPVRTYWRQIDTGE